MDGEVHYEVIKRRFSQLVELSPRQRRARLDDVTDDAVRSRLEELLRADAGAETTLDVALLGPPGGSLRLGPYEPTRLIARGGTSWVYEGRRCDGAFEKKVAIKVFDHALDRPDLVARFRMEQQILAELEHPSIARLLDGGITGNGVPYLILELVDGQPITELCDQCRLPLRERLVLMLRVCRAVQFAHEHLVVHRDLKPANILVDRDGCPRLLDFGIAKLLEPHAGTRTMTAFRMLTPGYASPEHLSGGPITTAADTYSLGILLYELLTGHRPSDWEGQSPRELVARLADQPVEPPSRRIRTRGAGENVEQVATERRLTVEGLARELAGDLDRIVLESLQFEVRHRYASAQHLAEDLQRYLEGRPISARPPSLSYRSARFVRRNRLPVALASVAVLALLAYIASTALQARRLQVERDKARGVASLMVDLFGSNDPALARGAMPTARQILDDAARRIDLAPPEEPEIRATLQLAIGESYRKLGLYDESRTLLEDALEIRRAIHPADHPEVLETTGALARLALEDGRYELAEALFLDALRGWRSHRGAHDRVAAALEGLARLSELSGDRDAAADYFQEALDLRSAAGEGADPRMARSLNGLGGLARLRNDHERAEQLLTRALRIQETALGANHPELSITLHNLGSLERSLGHYDRACTYFERAAAIREVALGDDHPALARTLLALGSTRMLAGKLAAARLEMGRALEILERSLEPNHQDVGQVVTDLAWLEVYAGDLVLAEELFERSLAIFPPGHERRVYGLAGLAVVEQQKGRFQRAEALQERVLELFRDQEGPVHLNVARTISSLAMLAAAQGETRRAEALFRESMSIAEEAVGEGHPWIIEQLYNLGELYLDVGQPERAEPLLRQGLEAHSGTLAERHPVVGAFLHGHAEALMELGRWDEASEAFLEVLTLRERLLEGDDRPQTRTDLATTLLRLGQLRRRQHRDEEARAFWSRAVELLEPVTPTSLLFAALDTHASVLLELHRVEDAKPLLARMAAQGPLHPALERLCRRRGLEVPVALSRRSRSSSTQSP